MMKVSWGGLSFSLLLYYLVGLTGYFSYAGSQIQSNYLNSL
jgi:hypothetical protein